MLRVLFKFQGGKFSFPLFAGISPYLPVNITGMENTHIYQHFANLAIDSDQWKVEEKTEQTEPTNNSMLRQNRYKLDWILSIHQNFGLSANIVGRAIYIGWTRLREALYWLEYRVQK